MLSPGFLSVGKVNINYLFFFELDRKKFGDYKFHLDVFNFAALFELTCFDSV